jgi:hypothetical protein
MNKLNPFTRAVVSLTVNVSPKTWRECFVPPNLKTTITQCQNAWINDVVPAIILQKEVLLISAGVILELMITCRAIRGMLFMSLHVRDVTNIILAKQATLSVPGYVYISSKLTRPNTDRSSSVHTLKPVEINSLQFFPFINLNAPVLSLSNKLEFPSCKD